MKFFKMTKWTLRNRRPLWGWTKFLLAVVAGGWLAYWASGLFSSREEALDCLARNIYWEAKGEPEAGQYMVAHVTMRRVKAGRSYWGGRSVCGVVYAKHTKRTPKGRWVTTAQFSWTLMPAAEREPSDAKAWERARQIAAEVYDGQAVPPRHLRAATFYLNPQKSAKRNICWFKKKLIPIGVVGLHHFYREPKNAAEKVDLAESTPDECKPPPKKRRT